MNPILEAITGFTQEQFVQTGIENDTFRRTAGRETNDDFAGGRNILVRQDGYADRVAETTTAIGTAMAPFGRISGRERILGALRWTVLADMYRDEISQEQYDALTTVYGRVMGLVGA